MTMAAAAPDLRHTGPSAFKHPKVLLVEDDPLIAESLVLALQISAGLDVHVAPTGVAALAACREMTFDTIIVDLRLPDTDGIALVAALRERGLDQPVMVLSAQTGATDRHRARGLDVAAWLNKPVSTETVVDYLQQMLTPQATRPESGLL